MDRAHVFALTILLALLGPVNLNCGKTTIPETDPYKTLSLRIWINGTTVQEADRDVQVKLTLKLGESGIYLYTRKGTSAGEEIESYAINEPGNYEIDEDRLIFTPDSGDPYTVTWEILAGSGDLELVYADGTRVQFTYNPIFEGKESGE